MFTQLHQLPCLASSGHHTEKKEVFAPKGYRQVEGWVPCPGLRLCPAPGGIITGFGPGEGFQSKFSKLKPTYDNVFPCVSHIKWYFLSMSWCVSLCMGFGVCMGVYLSGGCEKAYVLCQHEGPSVSACVCECVPEWVWVCPWVLTVSGYGCV